MRRFKLVRNKLGEYGVLDSALDSITVTHSHAHSGRLWVTNRSDAEAEVNKRNREAQEDLARNTYEVVNDR